MNPEEASLYLEKKYRTYDQRAVRYRLAADYMVIAMGMTETSSVLDIGGGDGEMEKCLREEYGWTGLYTNIDYVTGRDILHDIHPRNIGYLKHDFVVALEVIEHFEFKQAFHLLNLLPSFAREGTVISTPDDMVQNVYRMDPTHLCAFEQRDLTRCGYTVSRHMLYEGFYSKGRLDGLVAYKRSPHNTSTNHLSLGELT